MPTMLLVLATWWMSSCRMSVSVNTKKVEASDEMIQEKRVTHDFTVLNVAGPLVVEYIQGGIEVLPHIDIEGPDNIVELIEVNEDGEEVTVKVKDGCEIDLGDKTLLVKAYSSRLDELSMAGSGKVIVDDFTQMSDLDVNSAGSGHIQIEKLQLQGNLAVSIAGSGSLDAEGVVCHKVKTDLAGSGNIRMKDIQAQQLKASVSGSGEMKLSGHADEANYEVVGSGHIDARTMVAERNDKTVTGSGRVEL